MTVTDGISLSGQGALAQARKIDVLSQNLANAATPGFRRDRVTFGQKLDLALDRAAGPYDVTRQPLDFSLRSGAFFTVRDPRTGAVYYTRAGNFALSPEGTLTTAGGRYEVLGEAGATLVLDPAIPLRLAPDGTLLQGAAEAGRLALAEFPEDAPLRKRGDNLLENLGTAPSVPDDPRVQQGVLEGSNVNPLMEMAELVKALRALEANLQMLRIQDAVLGRTVNDFGRI